MKKAKIIGVDITAKVLGLQIGEIVTVTKYERLYNHVLVKLPDRLHGKGHKGDHYRSRNYWWVEKNICKRCRNEIISKRL